MKKPRAIRCAVYTRKSSEEGLDQEYNSLHAQRDACEAYIRSQVGEGWTCLKTAYDDGGISGGTMERPGLKQLLADIAARRIDVVVVYKVDRLTRSLWDFAKIVEVFDTHGVSFVSVTQSFNTTSSMGRLTLNMLLSFAQFEREVTSERIRDKIAASKKKGMWMGGGVPLGYEATGRTLKINEAEAETVRYIFRRYLELKSVHALVAELKAKGIRSRLTTFSTGRKRGGAVIDRGAAYKLLANPAYLGKVRHKDEVYEGLHPAIVDQETFDAVQQILEANRVKRTTGSARRTESALMGKLFDEAGEPMTPTFSVGRGGKRYRYYVSGSLQRGQLAGSCPDRIHRVPGPAIDEVVRRIAARCGATVDDIVRVTIHSHQIHVTLGGEDDERFLERVQEHLAPGERARMDEDRVTVIVPLRASFRGGRKTITGADLPANVSRPSRSLVKAIRDAHTFLALQGGGLGGPLPRKRVPLQNTYQRKVARLACLCPQLQAAMMKGEQPAHLTVSMLLEEDIPLSWQAQRIRFGRQIDVLPR
ncbi:recombinase family protein [Brevundimonas sp.]|uniref:recombinase family protein n=1 Tax=Brevundimonas sp. TaxID=1871086 RepID=UPI003AF62764